MSDIKNTDTQNFWQRNRKTLTTAGIIILGLLALVLAVQIGMRQPDTSTGNGDEVLLQVTADVIPGQALILESPQAGVSVFVPEGAITVGGFLSLVPREANLFTPAGNAWSRPTVVNLEFYDSSGALVPEIVFDMPINICFALQAGEWQALQETPETFAVQFWNETLTQPEWEDLSTFSLSAREQLCGSVSHLTLFALAAQMEQEEEPEDVYVPPTMTPVVGDAFELALEDADVRVVVPSEAGLFMDELALALWEEELDEEDPPEWQRGPVVDLTMVDEEGEEVEHPTFQNPIALCFALDAETWERYLGSATAFEIQYYDEKADEPEWAALDISEFEENQELCAAVEHLTLFALAERIDDATEEPGGPYEP